MSNLKKKIIKTKYAALLAGALTMGLTGCESSKLVNKDLDNYDVLDTNIVSSHTNGDSALFTTGVNQEREVNGEKFKLAINYFCGEEAWRINSNKTLYMEIKTVGLPADLEVYIDNIHVDTSIVASKEAVNGILQDTMDDHIHSSAALGFPIDDNHSYFGINEIEGQNETFIHGFVLGYARYGTLNEERRTESDYLSKGVWANKIDGVIDLLVVDKATGKVLRQVSVNSSLLVRVNNTIIYSDGNHDTIYKYNEDGTYSKTITKTLEPSK